MGKQARQAARACGDVPAPRGSRKIGARWTEPIFRAPLALPKLTHLRTGERYGDEILELLLESPLLENLRVLDLTDAITDRGAKLLYENYARLSRLETIWAGHSKHGPRATLEGTKPPPEGELEISDPWRNRLRSRLGEVLRFDPPPGHPNY